MWAAGVLSASAHIPWVSTTMFALSADCHRGRLPVFWKVEPKPAKWSVGVKRKDTLVFLCYHYPVPGGNHGPETIFCTLANLSIWGVEPTTRG